jgi:glutamate dehydrogenase/leucine dehydrogenase
MDVSGAMSEHGHEQLLLVADAATGLRAVIAIHSTALGPSLGGVRFWRYAAENDAIRDALALSEAMTWKAAVAGLDQGGGKCVVLVDDPDTPRPVGLLRALGGVIDAGATTRDMDVLATVTPWVTGVSEQDGGSGDPSPVTAWGTLHAIRAVLEHLDGTGATLDGRRVAIQGVGKVGAHLARLVTDAGARVIVADQHEGRARAVAAECRGDAVDVGEILTVECDVLAPCALGGVLDPKVVERLTCRAVCGPANNQLSASYVDELLAARGIVYVPDFVAGAGGIINIAEEFTGYSRERALDRAARIGATTTIVLDEARRTGSTPERVAIRLARQRLAQAGRGRRWEPGDPAAWTHGAPLRELRPAGTVT